MSHKWHSLSWYAAEFQHGFLLSFFQRLISICFSKTESWTHLWEHEVNVFVLWINECATILATGKGYDMNMESRRLRTDGCEVYLEIKVLGWKVNGERCKMRSFPNFTVQHIPLCWPDRVEWDGGTCELHLGMKNVYKSLIRSFKGQPLLKMWIWRRDWKFFWNVIPNQNEE